MIPLAVPKTLTTDNQNEKRSMDHFAGLDVSVKETSVCMVDDTGRIVREGKVANPRRCWRC